MDAGATHGRALVVSQYYRPEPIGSGPFCGDVAEWLAERGWRVTALTARPHYPDGVVFDGYQDGSRDFELVNGVEVRRFRTFVSPSGSARHRLAGEGSYFARCLLAGGRRRIERADLVISLCPSILSVVAAAALKPAGAVHVGLVHDIQSGLADGLGMMGGRIARGLRQIERHALGACDLVVVLSEEMRRHLVAAGVTTRIVVLPIWTDTEAIRPAAAPSGRARTALYSGNFGRKQGLMQLVELATALRSRGSDLRVVLRGRGSQSESIRRAITARGLDNVTLQDLVPADRVADGLAEGDIHLVPQDPSIADFAVPSKIYGIMAAARPFVANGAPGSTLWRLQRESGAFLCVPPDDTASFADAVMRLARDAALRKELGDRGRAYVVAHCSKAACLDVLFGAIGTLEHAR